MSKNHPHSHHDGLSQDARRHLQDQKHHPDEKSAEEDTSDEK